MTVEDPWATSAPEPEQPAPPAPATVVNNSAVPRDAEAITTTFKGGRDFDAPWVVTRAANVAEADALLDVAFKDYLEKVQRVAAAFGGAAPASTNSAPAPSRPAQTAQRPAPAGAQEAPEWAPPKPEPDFVYKSGTSRASGKVWHAWMPPTKDDPREAKFFYPPR